MSDPAQPTSEAQSSSSQRNAGGRRASNPWLLQQAAWQEFELVRGAAALRAAKCPYAHGRVLETLQPPSSEKSLRDFGLEQRLHKFTGPLPAATYNYPRPYLTRMLEALADEPIKTTRDRHKMGLLSTVNQVHDLVREETQEFFKLAAALFWEGFRTAREEKGGNVFPIIQLSNFGFRNDVLEWATPESIREMFVQNKLSPEERILTISASVQRMAVRVMDSSFFEKLVAENPQTSTFLSVVQKNPAMLIHHGIGSALIVTLSSLLALNDLLQEERGKLDHDSYWSALKGHEKFVSDLTRISLPSFIFIQSFMTGECSPDLMRNLTRIIGVPAGGNLADYIGSTFPEKSHFQLRRLLNPSGAESYFLDLNYDVKSLPSLVEEGANSSLILGCPANASVNRHFIPWIISAYGELMSDLFVAK